MKVYEVRYVVVQGVEQTEMPRALGNGTLAELPMRSDQVWLGEERYSVTLREIDPQNGVVTMFVELRGQRNSEKVSA